MMNKINSADQPFFVDGEEVAAAVNVEVALRLARRLTAASFFDAAVERTDL